MSRRALALVVVAALALVSCGSTPPSSPSSTSSPSSPSSPSGSEADQSAKAVSFSGTTLEGEAFDNASVEGKPEVLWFWAPWCTVCRAESGDVAKVARAFNDQVTFIGIPGRGKVPEMRQFVADTGTDGFSHVSDASGDLWQQFGVTSQPSFVFIDSSGKATRLTGSLDAGALRERVQSLLAS